MALLSTTGSVLSAEVFVSCCVLGTLSVWAERGPENSTAIKTGELFFHKGLFLCCMDKDKQNANFVSMEWQTKVAAEPLKNRFRMLHVFFCRVCFAGIGCQNAELHFNGTDAFGPCLTRLLLFLLWNV